MYFTEEIHRIPFLRLLLFLVAGIVLQINFEFSFFIIASLFIISFIGIIIFSLLKKDGVKTLTDFLKYLTILLLGILLVQRAESKLHQSEQIDLSTGYIIAHIIKSPKIKEKSVQAWLEIDAIRNENSWILSKGKVITYFEKDSLALRLKYGDKLILEASFNDIEGPKNPEEFDYRKYLAYHLIAKQSYLNAGKWKIIGNEYDNPIMGFSQNLREKLIQLYSHKLNLDGQELAVVSALTLGYKDKLEETTKQSYSASGALHLLAVSGLHIGLIYFIILTLLFFIPDKYIWAWLKMLILLAGLWTYAFVTGMPVSAFRATLMFSLLAFGRVLKRKPNIMNTIAASAFILLVINPYYITELGFQLSYAAVFGIVFFQPKISSIYRPQRLIVKWIWNLITVTVSAQIATFPISLYYFHQFPVYFIITNIIVLPLSLIVVYFSLLSLLFSLSPFALYFGKILSMLTLTLNKSVKIIEQAPYSKIENISINTNQLLILLVIIILTGFFITYKKSVTFKLILIALIAFFSIKVYRHYQKLTQNYFIVYNVKRAGIINFINGTRNVVITSEENIDKYTYQIKNNWVKLGLDNENVINAKDLQDNTSYLNCYNTLKANNIFYHAGIFAFSDQYFYLYQYRLNNTSATRTKLDYIIVTKDSPKDIAYLYANFNFKKLIFDSSIPNYKLKSYINECNKLGISYYSVNDEGAFVLKLS